MREESEREEEREIWWLLRGVIGTRDLSVYLSSRKTGPLNHGGMKEGGKEQGRGGVGGWHFGFLVHRAQQQLHEGSTHIIISRGNPEAFKRLYS